MPRKSSAANAPKRSDGNVRRIIGANIKARRLALDWNQQDLADRFGVSRSAVSQYEIGTGEVNAGDLPRLAKVLGISLLDFYSKPLSVSLSKEDGRQEERAGAGDAGSRGTGEAATPGATIKLVPTKLDDTVMVATPEPDSFGNDVGGHMLEMFELLQFMTLEERRTALRIVRALRVSEKATVKAAKAD